MENAPILTANFHKGPECEKNINTITMSGERLYQRHAAQRRLLRPLNNLKKQTNKKQ